MKVSFTPKEFARVLELVHFGMHVVTAYQGPETTAAKRYQDVEQTILNLAEALNCADLVEKGSNGVLSLSEKVTKNEQVEQVLSEHTNDAFWHELVARLADRDYASDQGEAPPRLDHPRPRTTPSLEAELKKLEDAYWQEFEKHDLAHVHVLRGGNG